MSCAVHSETFACFEGVFKDLNQSCAKHFLITQTAKVYTSFIRKKMFVLKHFSCQISCAVMVSAITTICKQLSWSKISISVNKSLLKFGYTSTHKMERFLTLLLDLTYWSHSCIQHPVCDSLHLYNLVQVDKILLIGLFNNTKNRPSGW